MTVITRKLDGPQATRDFAHELSLFARKGQTICLWGDLGVGKTEFARAYIRALAKDDNCEVPSPTFSLVQPYEAGRLPVLHFDLYRINGVDEIEELGFFDDEDQRITLIEWPDRLGDHLPSDRLDIYLSGSGGSRQLELTAKGCFTQTADRINAINRFLQQSGWQSAKRSFLQGDASPRRYERLVAEGGKKAILMDMPEATDGPAIKNGLPYSRLVHLAEGIRAVHAINKGLREKGFRAFVEYAGDHANGLMLIEDFGDAVFGDLYNQPDISLKVKKVAIDLLAEIAETDWPGMIVLDDNSQYHLKNYDPAAMATEVSLLTEWFWPWATGRSLTESAISEFFDIWHELFPLAMTDKPVWVLRDFHSPNLIWLENNSGLDRIGLIDTQDCVLGHPAYDLASFLQDARTDIDDRDEAILLDRYCRHRKAADDGFDEEKLRTAYAVLGAQRASKILGIFARLKKRDGKSNYLRHIPRVLSYLDKNLEHSALADLKTWFRTNLDAKVREAVREKT